MESPSSTPTLNASKYTFSQESSLRPFPFFSTLRYEEQVLLTGLSTLLVRMSFSNRREMFAFVHWRSWIKTNFVIITRHVFADQGKLFFFLKSKTQVKSHCFLNLIIVSCRASSRTAKVSNQTSLVTTGRIFCVDLFSLIKFEVKKDLIHESPLPGKFYSKASVKIQLLSKYT